MAYSVEKLQKILVQPGFVKKKDFDNAYAEAKTSGADLEDVLIDKGLIRDEQLGQLIASEEGFDFADFGKENVDGGALRIIPQVVARARGIIAFARTKDFLKVGMVNPDDMEIRRFLEKKTGLAVKAYYITRRDLNSALLRYKADISDAFNKISEKLSDESVTQDEREEATIKIVDMLLRYGHDNKASDIHIEPYRSKVVVRFRIDGVLHDVLNLPNELYDLVLSRIKVVSKMRTDEHRSAQDGKMRFKAGESYVDVRVSIVPVSNGENVVLRLLSETSRQFNLSDLGLREFDLNRVNEAIKNPHGMVLVTGPTGSGKTTTVYAVLKILNKRDVHISTIEDPVEYDIEGVSQIQVNTATNLTFAKGLRAIVRQDPDIIMVGEIRDSETAGIAVNSAMTGHLVLSTLHANDAATTLPRLLDMGIEPFLVASTVNVIIAQRLVRKICGSCRVSGAMGDEELQMIKNSARMRDAMKEMRAGKAIDKILVYHGSGCAACGGTGYEGRIGIFEVMDMSDTIKELVVKRAPSDEITAAARKDGMTTMLYDGIDKVLKGITTLQEIVRVTSE